MAAAAAQNIPALGFGTALKRGRSDTLYLGGSDSEGDGGGGDGGEPAHARTTRELLRVREQRRGERERERRKHAAYLHQRYLLLIADPYITQRLGEEVVNALASRFADIVVSLNEVRDRLEVAAGPGAQGGGRRRKSKRRRTKRHKRRKRKTHRRRRKYRKRRRSRRGGKKRRSMRGGAPPKGMKSWFENDYDVQRFRSAWQTKTKKVI